MFEHSIFSNFVVVKCPYIYKMVAKKVVSKAFVFLYFCT